MTNEEAKKMLKAKVECFKNETSGINHDCNMRLCDGCSLNYEQGNMGEQKEALDMAIKALEQQQEWIPVSERLPEEGEPILFSTKTGEVYEGAYFDLSDNRQWYAYKDENYAWNNVVIAWLPLPQPYRESEDK